MNNEDMTFPAPQLAPTRGLGERLDVFEAGLAQSLADGSRLAGLLMQLLVMLRDALARFGAMQLAEVILAEVAAVPAMDGARPMRVQRVRAVLVRRARRGVVAAECLAPAAVRVAKAPGFVQARDRFAEKWPGFGRVGLSNSSFLRR